MKIQLSKEEKKNLDFILLQFVTTHEEEYNIYDKEIKIAQKIIKVLNK